MNRAPLLAALLSVAITACTSTAVDKTTVDRTTPWHGGTLRYAAIGEPPSLDMMASTATITTTIATNIYEGLFTLDSHFAPRLGLAQSYQIKDKELSWVVSSRKGVLFHNGVGCKNSNDDA